MRCKGIGESRAHRKYSDDVASMRICLAILLTAAAAAEALRKEPTIVDAIRQDLFDLEVRLDRELSQPRWRSVGVEKVYMEALREYKEFGDRMDALFGDDREQHLESLDPLRLWTRVQAEMRNIDGLYVMYRHMQNRVVNGSAALEVRQWWDFSTTILTDPKVSIPSVLGRITDLIVNEQLFVAAYKEAAGVICNDRQSPLQVLYSLYTTVTLTEVKGYTMMQFAYFLKRNYGNGTFSEEMRQLVKQYQERMTETLRAVKTAMSFAPRDIWRCDPSHQIEDKTYSELKQVFQGYIINEVDMHAKGSCQENCAYYSYAKQYGCYQNLYCANQRRCNGKLVNCQYIDSDMWICPEARDSNRRYKYIQYENNRVFGKAGTCPRGVTKVDSWWRWLFWHCSYCMCYCDDQTVASERYWNLRDVVSDVENNRVITGVRLRKVNQVIHVQIQEGVLMPFGVIDESSLRWKPVENYTTLDSHVRNGVDYHTIKWESRGVDLDELLASDPQHVLTGIRFKLLGSRLNLEIRVTPFNFTSGKLSNPLQKSRWESNDVTDRTELVLYKPDIPTRSEAPSMQDSRGGYQYVNFGPTDLDRDAAQSTVPFLDIQEVTSKPTTLMSGAAIYHKGRRGYGGYIGLKLLTYNFASHLHIDLPPPPSLIGNDVRNEVKRAV